MRRFKDRFEKLRTLLQTYNPFGVVEAGDYVSYNTTRDAYVDIMMRISNFAPEGYIDIPLIYAVFMDIPITKGIELCRKRSEIIKIDMGDATGDTMDAWESLLKRLLWSTSVEFNKKAFYAAWPEFVQLKMKQKANNITSNFIFEKYYDTDIKECDDVAERDSE